MVRVKKTKSEFVHTLHHIVVNKTTLACTIMLTHLILSNKIRYCNTSVGEQQQNEHDFSTYDAVSLLVKKKDKIWSLFILFTTLWSAKPHIYLTTCSTTVAQWQILSLIIDSWQLLSTINLLASEIRFLNSSFSWLLGLEQPSLSSSYLQERIN